MYFYTFSNKTFIGLFWYCTIWSILFYFHDHTRSTYSLRVAFWPALLNHIHLVPWLEVFVWTGLIQPSSLGVSICAESLGLVRPLCLSDLLFVWICKSTSAGKSIHLLYFWMFWMFTADKHTRLPSIDLNCVLSTLWSNLSSYLEFSLQGLFFVFSLHITGQDICHWPLYISAALFYFTCYILCLFVCQLLTVHSSTYLPFV